MDTQKLVATGLNEQQAACYALLLETGNITPPDAAKTLKLSRTNAYKLLDKLVELGLAAKQEEAVNAVLSDLLAKYSQHTEQPSITVVSGRSAVADAYRAQINQLEPIYFMRSRSDITTMGFDTMHEIRVMPARHGVKRYGITPDLGTGTTATNGDERSNLERTWVKQEDYDAPVEWSVSGSTLLIVLFGSEPHAITITNPLIADAFRQIWTLLNSCLHSMPYYKDLPRL